MWLKVLVVVVLSIILLSLGSALFYLIKDPSGKKRTVKALTLRISLSILLFLFLILAFSLGWIKPHGV